MPSGYGMVQSAVMRMRGLSKESKSVYALLASYKGASEYCWPSIETQSNDLGCSQRSIKRYHIELEGKGLLRKTKKYPNSPSNLNQYEVMLIDNSDSIVTPMAPSKGHPRPVHSDTHGPQNINILTVPKNTNISSVDFQKFLVWINKLEHFSEEYNTTKEKQFKTLIKKYGKRRLLYAAEKMNSDAWSIRESQVRLSRFFNSAKREDNMRKFLKD